MDDFREHDDRFISSDMEQTELAARLACIRLGASPGSVTVRPYTVQSGEVLGYFAYGDRA